MEIKLYDEVILKDKRKGIVIEIYKDNEAYEVEFELKSIGKYPEYETETIKYDEIEAVL